MDGRLHTPPSDLCYHSHYAHDPVAYPSSTEGPVPTDDMAWAERHGGGVFELVELKIAAWLCGVGTNEQV